jgi:hypothetical protein
MTFSSCSAESGGIPAYVDIIGLPHGGRGPVALEVTGAMPGMNSGLNVDDPTVVAAFRAALLHQILIILAIFAVLSVAWVALRRPPAAGESETAPGGAMLAHNDVALVIDQAGHLRQELNFDPGPGTAATKSSFAAELAGAATRLLGPS